MTKKFCKQCGSALTKAGAKFCTTCGATVGGAEIDDISNQETVVLPGEPRDQAAVATEVIPAVNPVSYATEEMPKPVITARTEERATEVIETVAPTPATRPLQTQTEPAPEKQKSEKKSEDKAEKKSKKKSEDKSEKKSEKKSGGQKKLALVAAFGVVALVAVVAASYFFVNSRKTAETQAGTQLAGGADPSTQSTQSTQSAQVTQSQPIAQQSNPQTDQQLSQPSGAGANNQAQSQTRPQPGPSISEAKSPADRNNAAASKAQQQAAANPTPTPARLSAEEHKQLGINYMNSGRYQEALVEYENFRKLDPGNKDYYYLVASTYQRMKQLQQALEYYRQCTSGQYAQVSQSAVKNLEKQLKVNAK